MLPLTDYGFRDILPRDFPPEYARAGRPAFANASCLWDPALGQRGRAKRKSGLSCNAPCTGCPEAGCGNEVTCGRSMDQWLQQVALFVCGKRRSYLRSKTERLNINTAGLTLPEEKEKRARVATVCSYAFYIFSWYVPSNTVLFLWENQSRTP